MKKKLFQKALVAGLFATLLSPITVHAFEMDCLELEDANIEGAIEKLTIKLEDGIEVPQERIVYTYDSSNRPIVEEYYYYDTTSQTYILDEKNTNTFDETGNLVSGAHYSFDNETQQMVEQSSYFYEYNADGNQTSMLAKSLGVNSYKFEYEYLAGTNLITKKTRYNADGDSFVPEYYEEFHYNAQNLVECEEDYDYVYGQFAKTHKIISEYDNNGSLTLEKLFSYIIGTENLSNYAETIQTFDEQNRILSMENFSYTDDTKATILSKMLTTYVYSGNIETVVKSGASGSNAYSYTSKRVTETTDTTIKTTGYTFSDGDWIFKQVTLETCEYNSDGKLCSYKEEQMKKDETEYKLKSKVIYTYPSKPTPEPETKTTNVLAIILITLGSLIVIAAGLFAAWKIEAVKVGIDVTTRKLKFLDKVANPIDNLFTKIFKKKENK